MRLEIILVNYLNYKFSTIFGERINTFLSPIFFLIFIIAISIHLKFVEEKELIQRFREEYEKNKESVPAFIVRFKDLKKYFSFIF